MVSVCVIRTHSLITLLQAKSPNSSLSNFSLSLSPSSSWKLNPSSVESLITHERFFEFICVCFRLKLCNIVAVYIQTIITIMITFLVMSSSCMMRRFLPRNNPITGKFLRGRIIQKGGDFGYCCRQTPGKRTKRIKKKTQVAICLGSHDHLCVPVVIIFFMMVIIMDQKNGSVDQHHLLSQSLKSSLSSLLSFDSFCCGAQLFPLPIFIWAV